MPRTYEPQARKRARELYLAGLSCEEAAQTMRGEGYTYLNGETVRRWADKGNWKEALEQIQAEEGRAALSLDAERVTAEMLESYGAMRTELLSNIKSGQVDFADGVNLLLKIDGLRRHLLAQSAKAGAVAVDQAALSLEVLELIVQSLAELNPLALDEMREHLPELGRRLKERYAQVAV
ncbi:MAG: hypothetical protein ABIK12_13740 [Pseudomonadota bacterium]